MKEFPLAMLDGAACSTCELPGAAAAIGLHRSTFCLLSARIAYESKCQAQPVARSAVCMQAWQ